MFPQRVTFLLHSLFVVLFCLSAGAAQESEYDRLLKGAVAAGEALLEPLAFVAANKTFCAEAAPETAATVKTAADHWYVQSGTGVFYALGRALTDDEKVYVKRIHSVTQEQLTTLQQQIGANADAWCAQVPALLQKDAWQFSLDETQLDHVMNVFWYVHYLTDKKPIPPAPKWLDPVTPARYADMVARGTDPEVHLMPDEFRCYQEKLGRDYNFPDMILQVSSDGTYRSSFGEGSYSYSVEDYGDVRFSSGVLASSGDTYVSFNDYGQAFNISMDLENIGYYKLECYQQGAREQQALVDYALSDPQAGTYDCADVTTGQRQMLELGAYTYRFGGQAGTYYPASVMENGDEIEWLTGPLAGQDADYSEEYATGYRRISMSISESMFFLGSGGSSSSLSVSCGRLADKRTLPQYGADTAPPPPAGAGGLSGLYYLSSSDSDGNPRYIFRTFTSEGYVYLREPGPDVSDIDCSRTRPNGKPVCSHYRISGSDIQIDNETYSFARDGDALLINGHVYQPVSAATQILTGNFSGLRGRVSYDLWGSSSSLSRRYYSFSSDGRFTRSRSSESSMGSSVGGVSSYAAGSSSSSNSGSYTLSGNTLTLKYDDGRVLDEFILIFSPNAFYLNGFYMNRDD